VLGGKKVSVREGDVPLLSKREEASGHAECAGQREQFSMLRPKLEKEKSSKKKRKL